MQIDPANQDHVRRIIWRPDDQPTHVLVSMVMYARIAFTLLGMAFIDLIKRRIKMLSKPDRHEVTM
jgi:hypothetical protein